MKSIPAAEAARKLATLLKAVESGEEFILTQAGKPVARLTRVDEIQPASAGGDRKLRSAGWRDRPAAAIRPKPGVRDEG